MNEELEQKATSSRLVSENQPRLKSLRTYQGDIEEAMAKNKTSVVNIAVAEQKRKEKEVHVEKIDVTDIKNKTFVVIGLTLLVIGGIVLGAVYLARTHVPGIAVSTKKSILTYSQVKIVPESDVVGKNFVTTLVHEKETLALPINELEFISPEKSDGTAIPIETILQSIGPNISGTLARSFTNTYMFGIYSFDSNAPFMIFKTDDFGPTYSGMLKWEEHIATDLGPLFSLENASTTNVFSDESIHNKDLRILKDSYGKTVLMYAFIDKNTLVITSNEGIFNAILLKYQTTQMTR